MRRLILILSSLCLAAPAASIQAQDAGQLDRYAQEAQRALAEQRYDDAARAYEKLRELSPQTAEVHAQLGLVYFQQQAFAKAVPSPASGLEAASPTLPKVDVLLALCLSELGQYKEALPGLRKAFKQTADAPLRRLAGLQLSAPTPALEQDDKAVEVALELGRLYPGRSRGALSRRSPVRELRLPADDEARGRSRPTRSSCIRRRARPTRARASTTRRSGNTARSWPSTPGRPGIHFRIGRSLLLRAKQLSGAEASSARTEAVKEFEEELRRRPHERERRLRARGDPSPVRARWRRRPSLFARALEHYPDFDEGADRPGPRTGRAWASPSRPCRTSRRARLPEPGERGGLLPARAVPSGARQRSRAEQGPGGVPAPAEPSGPRIPI